MIPAAHLIDGDIVKQTMHGLKLAWSYHNHSWSVRCGTMRTPVEVYESDTLFRGAIHKRILYGSNISDSGLRKALRTYSGTQAVSNFRPTAAAALYNLLLPPEGGDVWDMSSGFGSRLLGAFACPKVKRYIGTDPCTETMRGLEIMRAELVPIAAELGRQYLDVQLHKLGSEVPEVRQVIERESISACATSPPYFSTERYSDEETQSYIKFPSPEDWLHGFMKETLANCWFALKPSGLLAINIANVKPEPCVGAR
jgi:hypothetical protein